VRELGGRRDAGRLSVILLSSVVGIGMHTFKQALTVIWLCALAGAAAYYFFFSSQPDPAHVSIPDYPPGWAALASCEQAMSSLDEREFLTLGEDHRASVEDHSASEIKFVEGRWAYDAPSKRYAVTLDGQTTTYSLLVKALIVCIAQLLGEKSRLRPSPNNEWPRSLSPLIRYFFDRRDPLPS
jgi:hypothetical protein